MATKKAAAPPAKPLGQLVDELWEQRERKRQLNEHLKTIETGIDALTSELIERMEKEGLDKMSGKAASLTVSPSLNPNIEDWDAVCAFIKRSGNWQLIRRQLNPEPWRELMTTRGAVPGTTSFIKKTLNMRTISKT